MQQRPPSEQNPAALPSDVAEATAQPATSAVVASSEDHHVGERPVDPIPAEETEADEQRRLLKGVDESVRDAQQTKAGLLGLIGDELVPSLARLNSQLGRLGAQRPVEQEANLALAGLEVERVQGAINDVRAKHRPGAAETDQPMIHRPARRHGAEIPLLERKTVELQRLHEDNDAIMRTLTTNLQSPLTALLLIIDLLGQVPNADTLERRIQAARRSVTRIDRVITQLWIAGEIESGSLAVKHADTSIQEHIHDAIAAATPRFTERSLRLGVDLPSEPIEVCVDPSRFRQMLEALLLGIAEFSPMSCSVLVSLSSRASAVHDTQLQILAPELGLGAQALNQLRLKRPWTPTGTSPGDAFGDFSFYIASELARTLGLGMQFEATSDVGTRFSFYMQSSAD